jgi:flavodoxin
MAFGKFLLLYGTQTGQAEVIAGQIRDSAVSRGLSPELHCLDKSEKEVHARSTSIVHVKYPNAIAVNGS